MATKDTDEPTELIARNKRARHDYEILDTWEAGIVLTGTEVKALRDGRANLTDAFGLVNDGEVYLLNLHIGAYGHGNVFNHDPTRTRKLLLHKRELGKLFGAVQQKGYACVALALYWKKHLIKCEIALAKGKKEFDKRATEKERDSDREISRVMRNKGKEE